MEYVLNRGDGKIAKCWLTPDEVFAADRNGEQKLYKQVTNAIELPHMFHHVALMPDAHVGYGVPNGTVFALDGAICPGAVGYDIGCGMNALRTDIPYEELREVQVELCRAVKKVVPVGEGGSIQANDRMENLTKLPDGWEDPRILDMRFAKKLLPQMGSLGGGNHFIEFDRGPDDCIWIVIHSGSRGAGHDAAELYMKQAAKLCSMWGYKDFDPQVAFLPIGMPEAADYIFVMNFMLEYAFLNRMAMMDAIREILTLFFGDVAFGVQINVHHNYAAIENHFGRNVWVHRKGATRARTDEPLVIPGNMGDGTAICRGLGNPDSFCSSSHGAGRRLGRREAFEVLTYEDQQNYLVERGVYLCAGTDRAIDESPQAYKPFDEVLERQADLVEVMSRLYPVAVIKG